MGFICFINIFSMRNKILVALFLIVVAIIVFKQRHYTFPPVCLSPLNFPLIQQPDQISCGPASCTMLLHWYGKDVPFQTVKTATKTEWFKTEEGEPVGMTAPELSQKALFQFGVPCRIQQGNIDLLKYYVSQKRFPIVLLRSGKTTWHYVVATGYDENSILFADPSSSVVASLEIGAFNNSWRFSHDMWNREIVHDCPVCKGTGKIFDIPFFGKCDLCGGTGRIDDYLLIALKTADIHEYTMIVPNKERQD